MTEDLGVRKIMVEKRLKKAAGILQEVIPPEYFREQKPGPSFRLLGIHPGVPFWKRPRNSEGEGKSVGVLHFSQVWPLVPDQFILPSRGQSRLWPMEGNATGQFAGLIRRESGFEIKRQIGRYDGLPITPEFILRAIK